MTSTSITITSIRPTSQSAFGNSVREALRCVRPIQGNFGGCTPHYSETVEVGSYADPPG